MYEEKKERSFGVIHPSLDFVAEVIETFGRGWHVLAIFTQTQLSWKSHLLFLWNHQLYGFASKSYVNSFLFFQTSWNPKI